MSRKHVMDLAMVLDRVETIKAHWSAPEVEDVMWNALYRDVLIAIGTKKCADPIACAIATLRPGTIVDEPGV